ncbi:DUF447 domain-containing protein [Halospeciosus flavus]|uniref:DUF447 domain-containing protein n=1 Tax=Halospeciosus flavus TaxID=3032283 RepID=A0ABD5Z9R8_9EURY|nr:DUF447 domain-containing protein [Halospeciosus flavus]
MSGERSGAGDGADKWPLDLEGVTETVVTTRGPNGRWNAAALGVHAPTSEEGAAPTARTFGNTRTRRNFAREAGGYVHFTDDPLLFVEAALSVREQDDPVLPETGAWVRVDVERVDAETSDGTRVETWSLDAAESAVVEEQVPRFDRGRAAVVEATVAASRLDVPAFDTETLHERLDFFGETARTCGGARVHEALDRLQELVSWRDRGE